MTTTTITIHDAQKDLKRLTDNVIDNTEWLLKKTLVTDLSLALTR